MGDGNTLPMDGHKLEILAMGLARTAKVGDSRRMDLCKINKKSGKEQRKSDKMPIWVGGIPRE